MRRIILMEKEQRKYEVIKRLVDNPESSKERASVELGITKRQINKLIVKYKNEGKAAFVHGNRFREPANKSSQKTITKILNIIKKKYQRKIKNLYFIPNFKHLKDLLLTNENISISYSNLYRILMANEIKSPKIHKETRRRLIKEKILASKQSEDIEDIEKIIDHQISIENAHPLKERSSFFGEEIQMDASSQFWNEDFYAHLHLAIDNSTGKIVGGYFDKQETLYGYYRTFEQILRNYGAPMVFKTDKRTVFVYKQNKDLSEEHNTLTQFAFACKNLGVQVIASSTPQFKAIIERANGTFEDRLKSEIILNNIHNIEAANKYLINVFIPKFNNQFAIEDKSIKSVFQKIDTTLIDYYLSIVYKRQVSKGCIVHFKSKDYVILNNKDQRLFFSPKTKCIVVVTFKNELFVNIDNLTYSLKEFDPHEKYKLAYEETSFNKHPIVRMIPKICDNWKYTFVDEFQKFFELNDYSKAKV